MLPLNTPRLLGCTHTHARAHTPTVIALSARKRLLATTARPIKLRIDQDKSRSTPSAQPTPGSLMLAWFTRRTDRYEYKHNAKFLYTTTYPFLKTCTHTTYEYTNQVSYGHPHRHFFSSAAPYVRAYARICPWAGQVSRFPPTPPPRTLDFLSFGWTGFWVPHPHPTRAVCPFWCAFQLPGFLGPPHAPTTTPTHNLWTLPVSMCLPTFRVSFETDLRISTLAIKCNRKHATHFRPVKTRVHGVNSRQHILNCQFKEPNLTTDKTRCTKAKTNKSCSTRHLLKFHMMSRFEVDTSRHVSSQNTPSADELCFVFGGTYHR